MSKKIGLTYNLKTDYSLKEGDPKDLYAEFDSPSVIDTVSKALEDFGHEVIRIGSSESLLEKIDNLDVDIVFNLAEGLSGRNRESQVPVLLEMKGIPFVGSDGLTLGVTLDKIMTKRILISEGLPTPKFIESKGAKGSFNTNGLKFPLMVKPRFEGTSKGITEQSRVDDVKSLERQIDFITRTYNQPALIEEFIKGKEFTVALVGNDETAVLEPVQVKIDGQLEVGDSFYTFADVTSNRVEYICPAKISKKLRDKLQALAYKAYKLVDCRDFGRVDFRVDEQDNTYILEINPLPSLSKEDVFTFIATAEGMTYECLINRIIEEALKRYNIGR